MFAGARGANAAQLTNAQKRLTLVTDMIVRNEAGVIVSSARSKDVLGAGNRKMAVGSINRNNDGAASLTRAATKNLVTVHRESDDSLPVLAKIEIVVEYSEDGQSIAIRSGKYSIIQTDPLVMYANAWYALMQKDKYVMNYFTESEASYETGGGQRHTMRRRISGRADRVWARRLQTLLTIQHIVLLSTAISNRHDGIKRIGL